MKEGREDEAQDYAPGIGSDSCDRSDSSNAHERMGVGLPLVPDMGGSVKPDPPIPPHWPFKSFISKTWWEWHKDDSCRTD